MYENAITITVRGIESIAALMIAVAVVAAIFRLVVLQLPARRADGTATTGAAQHDVRLQLGQHLVLALEFMIAADILKTVLAPTLQDLAYLGGIILIRTVLSISIAYELRRGSTQKPTRPPNTMDVSAHSRDAEKGCPW